VKQPQVLRSMQKRFPSCILPLCAFFSGACHREPTAPSVYRAVLRTDQSSYAATVVAPADSASRTLQVILQYTNESNAPIYLSRCAGSSQPALGTQQVDSTGFSLDPTTQVPFACSSDVPISVASGAIRTDTFTVSAPSPLPASIRLFYLASACGTPMGICMPLLPDSDRVSAAVQVRAAP
jgi:hypothetical protein